MSGNSESPIHFELLRGAETLTFENDVLFITGVTHGIVAVKVTTSNATAETISMHKLTTKLKPWTNALEGCTLRIDGQEERHGELNLLEVGAQWKASAEREKGIHIEFTGDALNAILHNNGTLQFIDYYR